MRTDSAPRSCPAARGSPRERAQRPLPSMMMAMCAGAEADGSRSRAACMLVNSFRSSAEWLDLHNFLFLGGHGLINGGNHFIRKILDNVGLLPVFVLGEIAILFGSL